MEIRFREIDPFNCWLWIRFEDIPSQGDKNYIDGVFDSWYVIGRLGGFNSGNLQAHQAGSDLSWMSYSNDEQSSNLPALMHNLGQLEYKDEWARCWVDLGTSDAIALDVLVNTLCQINGDIVRLKELRIGGVNEDWDVVDHPDSIFEATD